MSVKSSEQKATSLRRSPRRPASKLNLEAVIKSSQGKMDFSDPPKLRRSTRTRRSPVRPDLQKPFQVQPEPSQQPTFSERIDPKITSTFLKTPRPSSISVNPEPILSTQKPQKTKEGGKLFWPMMVMAFILFSAWLYGGYLVLTEKSDLIISPDNTVGQVKIDSIIPQQMDTSAVVPLLVVEPPGPVMSSQTETSWWFGFPPVAGAGPVMAPASGPVMADHNQFRYKD